MPIVATSPSRWTYSWVLAYLLSSGVVLIFLLSLRGCCAASLRGAVCVGSFGAFVKRGGDDARTRFFAANQNHEFGSQRRFPLRKICETDRLFQCRRVGSARHDSDLFRAIDDGVAMAADATVDHLEADELAAGPLGLLTLEDVAAVKLALVELYDPAEARFQGGRRGVDVIAVQGHLRLETQGVACSEAAGLDLAAGEELPPDPRRLGRRHVDFEAVLAGVTRARDDGRR